MAQREIAHETLAHKIFVGKGNSEGYKDGDVLAIAYKSINHGTLHNFYTLGSVVSCAIEMCSCPFEAVERAKKMGMNFISHLEMVYQLLLTHEIKKLLSWLNMEMK